MKNIFKSLLFTIVLAGSFSSCVDNSFDDPALNCVDPGLTANKTVQDIVAKGLYTAIANNSLVIGSYYPESPTEVGRISENEYLNFIIPSCDDVSEDSIVRPMTIAQAINNNNINTLIDLTNVQFVDASLNRTYYDIDSGGGATNHYVSAATPGATTQLIVRISSFAPFSHNNVPSGSGTIRGVLTKYGSDFQFMVRYESDIALNGPRVDAYPAIVGNNIQYLGAFTENFESYTAGSATTGQNNFPKYINDPVSGSKTWRCRTLTSNKYIEMSAFGTPAENNRTLFIVPVDMAAASNFSFQTRTNFYVGETLKVYYSTNYVPGGDINAATLVNITSNFALSTANTSTATFTNSGVYAIPSGLTGNGYFIFEYKGSGLSSPLLTTNMQIDNIVVN